MKALFFNGALSLREVATPTPAAGEALIHVNLAGICGTDRQIVEGYSGYQGILGHEFVGQVVDCADARWLGKRVVGEINVTCGRCDWCRRGLGRHCRERTVVGIIGRPGTFAEYIALPVENLHEVPDAVPDEAAVFTEPLAAAAEILEQMTVPKGARVAVLGSGRLGLLVAGVLKHAGADVTVIGRNAAKLQLARSWGIHTATIEPDGTVLEEAGSAREAHERERVLPRSFPIVVEATSSPAGLAAALELVEPRGTVVMKSTFHELARFDTARLVVDEITLLGSRCGNFDVALKLHRDGAVPVQELISKIFPLDAALEAFEYLDQPGCLKVLLKP